MSRLPTVLLTGSQGFIGSYVAQELLDNGYRVIGIDDYSKYGLVKRSHDNHPNFKLKKGDILGPSWSFRCGTWSDADSFDYIIHLAAKIGGIKYFHKYAYDLLTKNNAIDRAIFDLAIERKPKKLVYFSSSMVFESGEAPHHEDDLSDIPPPKSTYGFSKLSGEYYCKGMLEQYGIPFNIVRPFNCVAGEGEDTAKDEDPNDLDQYGISLAHVIPDFVYKAIKKINPFPIYGDGSQIRCFTHAKDIARGTRIVMEKGKDNYDYNIIRYEPITMLDLAKKIWKKVNPNTKFVPMFIKPFRYDVQNRSAYGTFAEETLGFKAEISLDESLDEVIHHMRAKLAN